MWQIWDILSDRVITGKSDFQRVHAAPMWEYITDHPDLGTAFDRWMTRQSNQHNLALVASYDFSSCRLVADIGGGQGSTLAAILRAYACVRGILLDLAPVVANPGPLAVAD